MSTLARIRRVIMSIPRGRVMSYGRVAETAGFGRAARLTVWALRGSSRLPWHRVVAKGGRIALRDYEGEEQRRRLRAEGVRFRGEFVLMERYEWAPRLVRRRSPLPRRRRKRPRARAQNRPRATKNGSPNRV